MTKIKIKDKYKSRNEDKNSNTKTIMKSEPSMTNSFYLVLVTTFKTYVHMEYFH